MRRRAMEAALNARRRGLQSVKTVFKVHCQPRVRGVILGTLSLFMSNLCFSIGNDLREHRHLDPCVACISGTRTLLIRSPASSTAGSPHRFIAAEAGVYSRGYFDPGGATGKICFPIQGEI